MHILEILAGCAAALVLPRVFAAILARQRFMLRAPGTVPVAFRSRTPRWQYGVARYAADDLRCYRSLRLGTQPPGRFVVVTSPSWVAVVRSRPSVGPCPRVR